MQPKAFALCLASLVAVLACEATDRFRLVPTHAVAMFRCGPVDQPGTAILLSVDPIDPVYPPSSRVEVFIWAPLGALGGRTWTLNTDSAGAWDIVGGDGLVTATSGHVTVTTVDSSKTLVGSVEAHFPSHDFATDFTAPWFDNTVTCG